MFDVGEYIVYGNNGVCRVDKIGPMDLPGIPKEKLYYTLTPVYKTGSKVFTPTDNEKVIMRPIISKTDALALIDDIINIEILDIPDERNKDIYKEAFRTCDCRELIKIIKTLYQRKQLRTAERKRLTASDEKYLHLAEESLLDELVLSLEMKKEELREFIAVRIVNSNLV